MADEKAKREYAPRYTGTLDLADAGAEEAPGRSDVNLEQFVGLLQRSYNAWVADQPNPAVGVNIPELAKSMFETRVRQAAAKLGYGVSVKFYDHTHQRAVRAGTPEGSVRAVIEAKAKRDRKPNTPKPQPPVEDQPNIGVRPGAVRKASNPVTGK
jgi:hypothetical protein